ncbi:MAG: haloacid dehalogenase-like hydrolase [Candidatus Fermentibacteria bacterium]|nr:haloacid dehalogenase-like hydrolase [Candidatus Fermentibacteria bacterium]
MKILILFDINGTLIKRDERTDIPFSNAVNTLLGTEDSMAGVDTSARSDKDVLIEVLNNLGKEFSETIWNQFLELYLLQLERFAETDVWRANVDAVPFVKKLYKAGYPLALITGELSLGARYKLKKIGIWDCFIAGGYGEDGLKRFDIADSSLKKVIKETGGDFEEKYVIGDTVLDIMTANHLGAKSIAITTGSHSREKLLAEKPDWCIDCFKEIEQLFPNR